MAQLVIKGHSSRGKDVIKILEMLGGKYIPYLNGTVADLVYYVRSEGWIDNMHEVSSADYIVFTLEEFLEKYPYKVGDKVSILDGTNYVFTIKSMTWDEDIEQVVYKIKAIDDKENEYDWLADELLYYTEQKEEPMENKGTLVEIDLTREESKAEEIEVILGDYEFVLKNGKTYFVKKKPEYPKTYEECCKMLGYSGNYNMILTTDVDNKLFNALYRLKVCRDAYWKIAGLQNGLCKPWKQDYNDRCFIIANHKGNIHAYEYHGSDNVILAFPTKEMRDAFKENFDKDIDECKEFL